MAERCHLSIIYKLRSLIHVNNVINVNIESQRIKDASLWNSGFNSFQTGYWAMYTNCLLAKFQARFN